MTERQECHSKVNPFTLFLILILLLASTGTLAVLVDALRSLVTMPSLETYHSKEEG
ncbi:MAG TPA: hypothetical protein GX735_01340 [Firmicutes bacterium]|jgi:hypothetical protein|nr:hypothetical protein [Bacillota bacterium]